MTLQNCELPKHIKDTIAFYESKYDVLTYQQNASGANAKSVPSDEQTTCRYCGKGSPEVRFKTDCHALVDSIGNRHLFVEDECDTCNNLFGSSIENHFGKWSLPYRVVSCIRGKKGYPSIKRTHLGWRIDSSASGLEISMVSDYPIASLDPERRIAQLDQLPRDPFIPIAVYKTFVRMALALMSRDELANFQPVIAWIRQSDHTNQLENVCAKVLYSYIPQIAPPDTVAAALARRHTDELHYPYMVFVLLFSNYIFQVFVPSPKHLQNNDFTGTFFPLLYGPDPEKPIKPQVIDLSKMETVRNETVPFSFIFETVEHRHTSRHENIATKAYYIWLAGGSKDGHDLADWLLAEHQIMSEFSMLKTPPEAKLTK